MGTAENDEEGGILKFSVNGNFFLFRQYSYGLYQWNNLFYNIKLKKKHCVHVGYKLQTIHICFADFTEMFNFKSIHKRIKPLTQIKIF